MLPFLVASIQAQQQSGTFSGSDKGSYQCFDANNRPIVPTDRRNSSGQFLCLCNDRSVPLGNQKCGPSGALSCVAETNMVVLTPSDNGYRVGEPGDPGCLAKVATLKPPTLQILEIWFVRILYIVWAIIGSLSFFYLVVLGYRYMISRGDVTKITEIRQKIIYYIIGVGLVFLAVPILTTIFRLMGINDDVDCYNVEMPAFQFFFAELCTAPNMAFYCYNPDDFETGLACQVPGQTVRCNNLTNGGVANGIYFCSISDDQTWRVVQRPT